MKIAKISKKLIKPHTPTPPNLKNYYLSFIDRYMQPTNIAVVQFYQSKPENIEQLEESLAKILVQFYPLAGRYIKNDPFVDCSDQGAEFVVAEALDVVLTRDLLPDQCFRVDEAPAPLLSVQVTHFPSGGMAIAFVISHTVFDVPSLDTFIAAWARATNPDNQMVGSKSTLTPSFDLPSLLPYKEHDFGLSRNELTNEDGKIVVKRLPFDNLALTRLRSLLSQNRNGKTISRACIVCAVIAKALIALDRAKHGRSRDFMIIQAINMRGKTILPQPKHSCRNLWMMSLTRRVAASEAEDIGLQELVDLMREAAGKSIADYAEILSPNRDGRDIIINTYENIAKQMWNPDTNIMSFSDWSMFGFYETDFGWGKPVWTSIGPQQPVVSTALLLSNKESDGIEAWLHLNKNDDGSVMTIPSEDFISLLEKMAANSYQWPKERRNARTLSYADINGYLIAEIRLMRQESAAYASALECQQCKKLDHYNNNI